MPTISSTADSSELPPEVATCLDPLLRYLVKSNISPFILGLIYVAAFYAARLLAVGHFDYIRTKGDVVGFIDDPAMYTNAIVGLVIMVYYMWMPRGIVTLFARLKENGVIGPPLRTKQGQTRPVYGNYDDFTQTMHAMFVRRWWAVIALAISTGGAFIFLLPTYTSNMKGTVWWADNLAGAILATMWGLVGIYLVLVVLFYVVIGLYWLIQVFNHFEMNIRPLHPDRAGGLSPLGNFTLTLSYAITVLGMILVITPITRNYLVEGSFQFWWNTDIVVGLGIYAVIAPFVFFAPLSVAHNAMKEAKNELLLRIAKRFEQEYDQIQNSLDSYEFESDEQPFDLKRSLEHLEELQKLHETTSAFPVWPFNMQNITRFSTSFVSPIALAVIGDVLTRAV